ncbi:MAG TPA: 3-oxoadipate enol-lactonase [Candidatus Limnocylindrales bacterium]|nr:3-oxoadipate enol-lactonase [Candidatus Limnocylindrales bacterium]
MPFAKLPDVQLYYEWSGPENSPVLLFSNSLGTHLHMWDLQLEEFTRHFRVLRYDTRGHGQSGVSPGSYSIKQLGRDVVGLLDSLHIDRIHFCGLSMGGMIGMFLGANAAKRLNKLVLCNTAAKIGTAKTWNTRIQTVKKGGMKAVASGVIERWLTPSYRSAHPATTQAALAMLETANPKGYVACCAAVRDMDQRKSLSKIRVPCLVLTGAQDPVTPPTDAHFLTQHIPGAKYAEVPAAHLSNIEAREDFNRHVLQFLLA